MKKFWLLNHLEICHLGWWLMLMYKDCQPERQDRERQRDREKQRQTDRGRERERDREKNFPDNWKQEDSQLEKR